MKVGDVVETTREFRYPSNSPRDWIGVIIEIIHQNTKHPDYRTPSVLHVFFPDQNRIDLCYKNEIKVLYESR